MFVNFEAVKSKAKEMLPKAVKWIIVHLLMLLYHFKMPIWVTVLKATKTVKKIKTGQQGSEEEISAISGSVPLRHEKLRARRDAHRSRRNEIRF